MESSRRAQLNADMVRFSDGHREAFVPVFDALWPELRRFCSRLLTPAEAEDAAQAAMIKLCGRIHEFERERDGLSWALGIATNEVRALRRDAHRRREQGSGPLEPLQDGAPLADETLDLALLQSALTEVLGQLSQTEREILLGTRAPIPATAADRKRKQRALEKLKALWRRIYGSG